MKTRQQFPVTITESGVSAKIYRGTQTHSGTKYQGFIVAYSLLGKRKQVWRSDYAKAKATAEEACQKIANGEQLALTLTNHDRMEYLRATEANKPTGLPIDVTCRQMAEALSILKGKVSIAEACRDWMNRHAVELPRITVAKAVDDFEDQSEQDGRSANWRMQLSGILKRFSTDFAVEVHTITPDLISRWLSGLDLSERTRRNYRDVVGYFNRFLVRRGHLAKGTDWLDGVQNYTARKTGEIEIYSPEEITKLLRHAQLKFKSMVPFVAIAAFAGLRHSEIARLTWTDVDISDKPGESFIEVKPVAGTKSDQRRRFVPIKDNLKEWLLRYRKDAGPLSPKGRSKNLLKIAAGAEMAWKHNAPRHSYISYRAAESSDLPRISEECGNSIGVIKTNYLRRVRPPMAEAWFSIQPDSVVTA
jgi:integrase